MPWLIGGGVLLALMLSSKKAVAPTAYVAPHPSSHSGVRSAPAWRISVPRGQDFLVSLVNYFTHSTYDNAHAVPAAAYATAIHAACTTATTPTCPTS